MSWQYYQYPNIMPHRGRAVGWQCGAPWSQDDYDRLYDDRMMASRLQNISLGQYNRDQGRSMHDRSSHLDYRARYPGRTAHDGSRRIREISSHHPRSTQEYVVQAREGLPFGNAMTQLYRQLQQTERLYLELHKEFECDISEIKKYASPGILGELWSLKVQDKPNRDDGIWNENTNKLESHKETSHRSTGKFAHTTKKLMQALERACTASLSPCQFNENKFGFNTRLESARRLQEKVTMANTQVLHLLSKASDRREDCKALLRELEILKSLVDPVNDMNRDLYRDDDILEDPEPQANEAEELGNEEPYSSDAQRDGDMWQSLSNNGE